MNIGYSIHEISIPYMSTSKFWSKGAIIAQAAALLGVSSNSVKRALTVSKYGAPELDAAVLSGKVSVSAAAIVASHYTHEDQIKILAGGRMAVAKAAKGIRERKASERQGVVYLLHAETDNPNLHMKFEELDRQHEMNLEQHRQDRTDPILDITIYDLERSILAYYPVWHQQ